MKSNNLIVYCEIEDGKIVSTIKKSIENSANAVVVDDKVINASAMMYNLGTDLKRYGASISDDIQTTFGTHIGDFRNEAVDSEDTTPFVACILAGLTEPTTRIDKVISRRMKIEKEINERKAASTKLSTVESGKLSLSAKQFGASTAKPNVDDILKKFTQGK